MLYFAYGSNLWPPELQKHCPSANPLGKAKLAGYRLEFTRFSKRRGGGVADIVPDAAAAVWGALYEIPEDEWGALDRKEGYPEHYTRQDVAVEAPGKCPISASTYMVADKSGPYQPTAEYLGLILKGARWHDLPDSYVDSLRPVSVS